VLEIEKSKKRSNEKPWSKNLKTAKEGSLNQKIF